MNIVKRIHTTAGRARMPGHKIDSIIVHAMAEFIDYQGERYFAPDFLNKIGLSCHYMVDPSGGVIECAHPLEQTAYHAKGFNTHSIGIEILVPGVFNYSDFINRIDTPWVSDSQMSATCNLVAWCFNNFPIDTLLRHCDVSPQRKKDPGLGFNWEWLTDWLDTETLKDWSTEE